MSVAKRFDARQLTESGKPVFEDAEKQITVTPQTLRYRARSYPIRSITKVADFKWPFEFGGFMINLVLAVVGAGMILTFSVMSIIGLILGAIGFFNVKNICTKKYMVIVHFGSDEEIKTEWTDLDRAVAFRDALNAVM